MGLGSRTARQHQTQAAHLAGVDASSSWDFQPGQAVMTVDGFSGKVTAVNDGPLSGTESYLVTLDDNLGGGEYTASQLSAKHDASQYTAAADYPELAGILVERPDIAPNTRYASKTANSSRQGPHGIETFDELEPNDGAEAGVDEHGHLTWDGASPACRDTDEYSMFGQNDAVEKQARYLTEAEARAAGVAEARRQGKSAEEILRAQAHWTDADSEGGLDHNDRGKWSDDYTPEELAGPCHFHHDDPADKGTHHLGDHFDHYRRTGRDSWGRPIKQPYDGHGAWSCNNFECTEHPQRMYDQPGLAGMPGWLNHDAGPDAQMRREVNQAMSPKDTQDANWLLEQQGQGPSHLSSLMERLAVVGPMDSGKPCIQCAAHGAFSSQETVGKCDSCDERKDIYRYRGGKYEGAPESLCLDCLGSGHHLESAHDPDEADVDTINHLAKRPAGEGGFHPVWMKSKQSTASVVPWGIVTEAAGDPDFRFHVTAAWSDVRAKAKRIRSEGGVRITAASDGLVMAEVKGDHHVYETGLQRLPGQRTAVATWSCGCKWGAYHWGADDDFSRFAGRMCSHALALQYEAQSRGMFGRNVAVDDAKPSWVPRRVVVKYDIDADRNVKAPSTMHASLTVAGALLAAARHENLDEVALAFQVGGLDITAALRSMAAVNDAWGEPTAEPTQYAPGPTSPPNPEENPASAGWASAPEPSDWGNAGPSGLTHMVSSRSDDEAMFEPEMGKEAFLPLLVPLIEGVGAGAAAAGAAEVGAGAAAAGAAGTGAGAAGVGGLVRSIAPKVLQHEVVKKVLDGGDEGPEGPQGPQAPAERAPSGENPVNDDPSNPLNFGARATLHEEPEAALPSTDGDLDDAFDPGSPSGLEPESTGFVSTGGIEQIVADFQRTAGASTLAEGSGGGAPGSGSDASDIAAAAKMFLETGQTPAEGGLQATALKAFTPAEQQRIINEGENVRAANLDRLDIAGTHYEPLEAALAASDTDEEWLT